MACGDIQWIGRLFSQNSWIRALAHLFCISVFLVQLFRLFPTYFAPTMTYTEVTNVHLQDIDFPLDFEICVKPLLNSIALQKFGYLTPYLYTVGTKSDNTSVGWGGYDNNSGAVIGAKEVLKEARLNVITNLLNRIHISRPGENASENLVDIVSLDKINWVYECHTLNMSNVKKADLKSMDGIAIFFNRPDDIMLKNNITVELRVMGQTLKSKRGIQEHRLYAAGDDLKLESDDFELNQFSNYIIKIKKNVFVEEDRTKDCRNYPNLDFESYKDCDFQYMMNKVKEMNLMPPWLTDDLDNVTSEPVKFTTQYISYQLGKLVIGMDISDCQLPCTHSWKQVFLGTVLLEFLRQTSDNMFYLFFCVAINSLASFPSCAFRVFQIF